MENQNNTQIQIEMYTLAYWDWLGIFKTLLSTLDGAVWIPAVGRLPGTVFVSGALPRTHSATLPDHYTLNMDQGFTSPFQSSNCGDDILLDLSRWVPAHARSGEQRATNAGTIWHRAEMKSWVTYVQLNFTQPETLSFTHLALINKYHEKLEHKIGVINTMLHVA